MYNQINQYRINVPTDFNDILIVDGTQELEGINHDIAYYKTIGLAEYLSANRLFTKCVLQRDFDLSFIKFYRGFVFYNVTINAKILEIIAKINYFNKKIFIDFSEDFERTPEFNSVRKLLETDNKIVTLKNYSEKILIPDEILLQTQENSEDEKVYIVVNHVSSEDDEFLNSYLQTNYQTLKESKQKLLILKNVHSSSKVRIHRKFAGITQNYFYKSQPEKLHAMKRASTLILKNTDSQRSKVYRLEGELCGRRIIDFKQHTEVEKLFKNSSELLQVHSTLYAPVDQVDFIQKSLNPSISFAVAGTVVRGGINVVVKHSNILRDNGYDVTFITDGDDENNIKTRDGELNVVRRQIRQIHANIDKLVATLWITTFFVESYPDAKEKFYIVQGYETDFSVVSHHWRLLANNTYRSNNLTYLTISKWCKSWLKDQFKKDARFCPNGLNAQMFEFVDKDFSGKIRILIEGSNKDEFRNIDESFRITNALGPEKYEVWYLTYDGEPKKWYKYSKFLLKVPYEKVAEVYQSCHILLKSSTLESFSYPPLEMMATGGIAVVAQNNGNSEYIQHKENCMVYQTGDEETAINNILEVVNNSDLRSKIIKQGRELVNSRDWSNLKDDVLNLYK